MPKVRFILRHTTADSMTGAHSTGLFTVLAECPEIAEQIRRGGVGSYGWECVDVVGAELERGEEKEASDGS